MCQLGEYSIYCGWEADSIQLAKHRLRSGGGIRTCLYASIPGSLGFSQKIFRNRLMVILKLQPEHSGLLASLYYLIFLIFDSN
jgi:hypothetical protein